MADAASQAVPSMYSEKGLISLRHLSLYLDLKIGVSLVIIISASISARLFRVFAGSGLPTVHDSSAEHRPLFKQTTPEAAVPLSACGQYPCRLSLKPRQDRCEKVDAAGKPNTAGHWLTDFASLGLCQLFGTDKP